MSNAPNPRDFQTVGDYARALVEHETECKLTEIRAAVEQLRSVVDGNDKQIEALRKEAADLRVALHPGAH